MRGVLLAVDIDLKHAVYKVVHVLELVECRFKQTATRSPPKGHENFLLLIAALSERCLPWNLGRIRHRCKGASGVESRYDLLIAQTRQRGELVPKSPGSGRTWVKDAYYWNAPC